MNSKLNKITINDQQALKIKPIHIFARLDMDSPIILAIEENIVEKERIIKTE